MALNMLKMLMGLVRWVTYDVAEPQL